ncbi:MAG TPA: N-acetylmuramoyl-L-alanine amidase [Verrucomicrobiota bacterium]|nr:N-acetylmuramoyl-L-alanine amidase [Verrucomicrobiota bacterium]
MYLLRKISAVIVVCCLLIPTSRAVSASYSITTVFGREYVDISQYAKSKNLQFAYNSKNSKSGEVLLQSKWSKVVFKVDSRMAIVNGVVLWLSFPIAQKDGDVFISPIDIKTAIEPIILPPKASISDKINKICIDPGHGGKDPGNIEGNKYEKDYTLMLALELKKRLEKEGFKIVLTRTRDKFVDLSERTRLANNSGVNLFISVHFNSSDVKSVKGVETYCLTPEDAGSTNSGTNNSGKSKATGNRNDAKNMLFAYCVQKSLSRTLGSEDRGVKRARFAVLKEAAVPALLVECGFMSSPEDMQKITDAAWRKEIARGIVEGIKDYKKQLTH